MRVQRVVASITLWSTLWRTRIISIRATLWRIATASAWQWGSERATAGCDRDERRPGGWDQTPPVCTCSLSVVSCARAGNKEGDADAAVEGLTQIHQSISLLLSLSQVSKGFLMAHHCLSPLQGEWVTTLSFVQFTSILKVQQSLNFCKKWTFVQEGKHSVFGNLQWLCSAMCTKFYSLLYAAHRMKQQEVSKYFYHGIRYTSQWTHSQRHTHFGQKLARKLEIPPPISPTLEQCSVGKTVFCRKKQNICCWVLCLDGWFVVSSVSQSVLFCICKDFKQLLASLQTWVASWSTFSPRIAAVNYSEASK